MGKTGGEGGGANQMMYGFIFIMYAITAGVLFYVMINRFSNLNNYKRNFHQFDYKEREKEEEGGGRS